jgi:hypothetical protein
MCPTHPSCGRLWRAGGFTPSVCSGLRSARVLPVGVELDLFADGEMFLMAAGALAPWPKDDGPPLPAHGRVALVVRDAGDE